MCLGACPTVIQGVQKESNVNQKDKLLMLFQWAVRRVLNDTFFYSNLWKGGIPEQQKRNKRRSTQGIKLSIPII